MKLGLLLVILIAGGQSVATANDPCDADNGGIVLDEGFCAMVVADDLGEARHLVVSRSHLAIRHSNDRASRIR